MNAKRVFDIAFALCAIALLWPLVCLLALLVWLQDGAAPLYFGQRVGRDNRDFRMIKLRTMVPGSDALGGASISASDDRVTPIGRVLRSLKLDELPQLWNVLAGDMSVVGPRPNVRRGGVDEYSSDEMRLLTVRPGITDIASIVFADESLIIDGADDADQAYDVLIRPWKCRLGLLYVKRHNLRADLWLILATLLGIVARPLALRAAGILVEAWDGDDELLRICARRDRLSLTAQTGSFS